MVLKDGVSGLGKNYASQVHRATFSSNGTLLAVTDLGGWVDCWERDESDTWNSLTDTSPLPRLDAPAVAIGFRPSHNVGPPSTPEQLLVEDTIDRLDNLPPSTPRATSLQLLHSQHQQIINTTSDKHHGLFVLTSSHTLHEFDVTAGTLTAWSKRNPSEKLPQAFAKLMDRASGMNFTFESRKGLRLWLWSTSWVWMFNIDKDLVADKTASSSHHQALVEDKSSNTKRKRSSSFSKSKPEIVLMSGAGSKIPSNAVSSDHLQIHGKSLKHNKANSLLKSRSSDGEHDDDSDEDEEDETEEFLVDVTKSTRPSLAITNTLIDDSNVMDIDDDDDNDADEENEKTRIENPDFDSTEKTATALVTRGSSASKGEKLSWSTNKYRPLMAFLPIGRADERIEMVVVERPLYDVPLPPRFEDKRDIGR